MDYRLMTDAEMFFTVNTLIPKCTDMIMGDTSCRDVRLYASVFDYRDTPNRKLKRQMLSDRSFGRTDELTARLRPVS